MQTEETYVSMMLLLLLLGKLENPNVVRGNWIIGKVIEVFPGKDSEVRNVSVKTSCGEYERPVNRIAVIYPGEGSSSNFCMKKTFSSGRRVC